MKQPDRPPTLAAIHLRGRWQTIGAAGSIAAKQTAQGNPQGAIDVYDLILEKVPNHVLTHWSRGITLQMMGRLDEALSSLDKAVEFDPGFAEAYNQRGLLLATLRREQDALTSFEKGIELKPDNSILHNNRGTTLKDMRRYDEALTSFDRAIALDPGFAQAYYNRGDVLIINGDMREGEKMFLKALELKPGFPGALFRLTHLRKYSPEDHSDLESARISLGKPDTSLKDREALYFCLGKIYDDRGNYDEAFECYREGNQIRNATLSYDARKVTGSTDRTIEVFNQDFLARRFAFASDDSSPLFVVGMPRSGTTLIASILSNHASIATAGELNLIEEFTSRLPGKVEGGESYPELVNHLPLEIGTCMTSDYLQRLRRDIDPGIPYVIDKHPLNFRHLGLIAMLFPKSRIIHCTRHPLDTCLSTYFQAFSSSYDYSFDLRNIGHYYQEYSRLMEHWRKVLPIKIVEISYEDIVIHSRETVRTALNRLGFEWDERCLAPHTNSCAVETASQWQVRQPIYNHSVARWKYYKKHLLPLREMSSLFDFD